MRILLALLVLFVSFPAQARNTQLMFPYKAAMGNEEAKLKLGDDVKFYFGDQKHPAVGRKIGTWVANKKTNALNKSDERACQWAFLSAMVSLRQRAMREGGNETFLSHVS